MRLNYSFLLLICLTILFASFVVAQNNDSDNFFLITVNDKQGFIDKTGKIVIEPIYEQVRDFAAGFAPVKIKEKWGFIDKSDRVVIEPKFDEIRWSFREDLASVRMGKKWGYIDKSGNFVINPTLEYGHLFYEDRAVINVDKNGKLKGIIDKTGKLVTNQLFESSGWSFNEGLLDVKVNGKWGFIDTDGKFVIEPKYKDANGVFFGFSEGLATVKIDGGNNLCGFIDKSETIIISPQFEWCSPFSNGLAGIRKDGKYGFIDKKGNIVIKPQFDWFYSFSEGLAAVEKKGKWGFIDKTGKFVVTPKYDEVWSFNNGLASISVGKWKDNFSYYSGKWGYIDKTGKVIWQPTK